MPAPVNNKESLLQRVGDHGKAIKSFEVKDLDLFGSFALNNSIRPDSDIDFLVEFEPGQKTFNNFMDLSFFLEELLGRNWSLSPRNP
jgi:predicted nucleotidyltransferase